MLVCGAKMPVIRLTIDATKHLDARCFTRVDHDATHINLAHEEFRVRNILFQDSEPAARQCSFQKYSH